MTDTNAEETPFSILAHWAWAKVQLEDAQAIADDDPIKPYLVEPAIVEYRHWLRKKRKLDSETESTNT